MKIRKVKIGIKDVGTALQEFVSAGKAIEAGKPVKKDKGVYYTDFESFRKAITPQRLALIRAINLQKPVSLQQLSQMVNRNMNHVAEDIQFLEQVGLVDTLECDLKYENRKPLVNYDKILFEIAVA